MYISASKIGPGTMINLYLFIYIYYRSLIKFEMQAPKSTSFDD
jgi:hypothetical protein